MRYLLTLIPRPAEIAEMGKEELRNLITANISVGTTYGDIAFDFTFGFFGETRAIQKVAGVLADYFAVSIDGNTLSASARVPEIFTKAYRKLIESNRFSAETKNMLFSVFGKTTSEIFDKVTEYGYQDILNFFKGRDYQTWFQNFLSADFINTYFGNYIKSVFGRELADSDIDRVINAFSSRAAQIAAKGWTYDSAYNFLEQYIPGFDTLVSKLPVARIEAAVNKLMNIVNRIDWQKFNAEYVREIVAGENFNDTVESYIERFEGFLERHNAEGIYEKLVAYAEQLFSYLPERVKGGSILDLYDGNTQYSHNGTYNIPADRILAKIVSVLENRGFGSIAEYVERAYELLGGRNFTVNLSLELTIPNVYRVEYKMDPEAEAYRAGLLPVGTSANTLATLANIADVEGYEVLDWFYIENGEKIYLSETGATMPAADIVLYPVTEFAVNAYVNGEAGNTVEATYNAAEEYVLSVEAAGASYATYNYVWAYNGEELAVEGNEIAVSEVKDSGVYTVVVTDTFTGYVVAFEQFEVNIEKQEVVVTVTWTVDGETAYTGETAFIYNGKQHTVAAEYEAADESLFEAPVFAGEPAKNVGQYNATWAIALTDEAFANYTFIVNEEEVQEYAEAFAWEIEALEIEVAYEFDGEELYTYDGTDKTVAWIVEIEANDPNMTFTWEDLFDYEAMSSTEKNVGEYTLTLALALKAEYEGNVVVSGELTAQQKWEIEKAILDIVFEWGPASFTYSGELYTVTATAKIDPQSAFAGMEATLLGNIAYTGYYVATVIGEYEVVATVALADEANFELGEIVNDTLVWEIVPIGEVTDPTNSWAGENWTADNEYVFTVGDEIVVEYTGIPAADAAAFTEPVYTYADAEENAKTPAEISATAGTYTVTVTFSLVDGYVNGSGEVEFEFTATIVVEEEPEEEEVLDLTGISWSGVGEVTYNGQAKTASITFPRNMQFSNDQKAEVLGWITYFDASNNKMNGAPVNVGTYTVKLIVPENLGYEVNCNLADAELKIIPAEIAISGVNLDKTQAEYTGSMITFNVTGINIASNYANWISYAPTSFSRVDVGEYTETVAVSLKNQYAQNYVLVNGNKKGASVNVSVNYKIVVHYWDANKVFTGANGEVEVTVNGNLPTNCTVNIAKKNYALDNIQDQLAELFKGYKVTPLGFAYDINVTDHTGADYTPNGVTFTVKINVDLSNAKGTVTVLHIHNGEVSDTEAVLEGGVLEFTVTSFSDFVAVSYEQENFFTTEFLGMPMWLFILLVAVAGLLFIALIVVLILIAKVKLEKTEEVTEEPVEEEPEALVEEAAEEEATEEVVEETAEEEATEEVVEEPVEEEATEETAEEAVEEEAAEEVAEEAVEEEATEEVVEEPAEEAAEEIAPIVAPVAEEEEEEQPVVAPEEEMMSILDRSFMARLSQVDRATQQMYSEMKNYILSFKYVRSRVSWKYDTFNKGRNKIAKFQLKGKSLVMYAAIDPNELSARYHHRDVSKTAKYKDVPTKLKLRSPRSLKYAKLIIDAVMAKLEIERETEIPTVDYTVPYKSNEQLIADGEIKEKKVPAPVFWNMDASVIPENIPALPEVELNSFSDDSAEDDE